MKFNAYEQGKVIVIDAVTSEYDYYSEKDALQGILDRSFKDDKKDFLIDFNGLQYVNAMELSFIAQAYGAVHEKNGSFKVCNLSDIARHLFTIFELDKIIDVYKTKEDALRSYE